MVEANKRAGNGLDWSTPQVGEAGARKRVDNGVTTPCIGGHPLTGACVPVRADGIMLKGSASGLVLEGSNQQKLLDPFSATLWTLCDGRVRLLDIAVRLAALYGIGKTHALVDATVQLHQWAEVGLMMVPGLLEVDSGEEQIIDLRDLPIYVINCLGSDDRRDAMTARLEKLGLSFEFVPGIRAPSRIGVALSHLRILARENLCTPFVVLEDDCAFTGNFVTTFHVPTRTDALYLGISHFGSASPGQLSRAVWRKTRWLPCGEHYWRIFNMFSRHAIVYLSEDFRVHAARATVRAMTHEGVGGMFPGDAAYAMLHASHLVLSPRQLMTFQAGPERANDNSTRLPLDHAWSMSAPSEAALGAPIPRHRKAGEV